MKTLNSLSGGKTSSYIAVHYPADYEIFALVTIEDKKCSPNKWLIQQVSNKLGKEFIATAEHDRTLYAMFDLEQKIGREIIWVSGNTFDKTIVNKGGSIFLPNKHNRFCTQKLKVEPIFNWWRENINEIVETRIGYRYDEKERQDTFSTAYKAIVGKSKTGNRNKWANIEWRVGSFPLIDDKINHWDVVKFWKGQKNGIINFPADSNCVGCFWKDIQQLRKNWEDNPEKMHWFANQETKKRRWKTETTYDNIAKVGLQKDFNFGTGAGCQSGECTP